MKTTTSFNVICPECGERVYKSLETSIYEPYPHNEKKIINCDEGKGGCGIDFVAVLTWELKITTKKIVDK